MLKTGKTIAKAETNMPDTTQPDGTAVKSQERTAFFFLAFILAPAVAVALVVGWGFSIWILQMFFGPPGAGGGH
jgi:nitrate reductase NapE